MNLKQMFLLSAVASTLLFGQASQAITFTKPIGFTNFGNPAPIADFKPTSTEVTPVVPAGSTVTASLGLSLSNNPRTGLAAKYSAIDITTLAPTSVVLQFTDGAGNNLPYTLNITDFSVIPAGNGTAAGTSFTNAAGNTVSTTYSANKTFIVPIAGGFTGFGYKIAAIFGPGNSPTDPNAASLAVTGNITVSIVPEPGAMAIGISGALTGAGLLRRRRSKK